MSKNKKRLVREVFNAAVKELRRKKHIVPKVYLFDAEGKKYTCSPTFQDPFAKMFEAAVIKEMCKRINAEYIISVSDAYTTDLDSNVRPSRDPNRKEALMIYYEDVSENYMMLRKYNRTRHGKIVFTGKTKKHSSWQGPLTNFLPRPEDDSPLAVSKQSGTKEVTV